MQPKIHLHFLPTTPTSRGVQATKFGKDSFLLNYCSTYIGLASPRMQKRPCQSSPARDFGFPELLPGPFSPSTFSCLSGDRKLVLDSLRAQIRPVKFKNRRDNVSGWLLSDHYFVLGRAKIQYLPLAECQMVIFKMGVVIPTVSRKHTNTDVLFLIINLTQKDNSSYLKNYIKSICLKKKCI